MKFDEKDWASEDRWWQTNAHNEPLHGLLYDAALTFMTLLRDRDVDYASKYQWTRQEREG
jgi:hypothetical protein